MKIISIKDNPEYENMIIEYFCYRWASEDSKMVYVDCIKNAKRKDSLPNWYLLLDDCMIVGGAGLISNDFISRMDLCPWLCALYIEEDYRGNNYASLLINKIKEDALQLGYDTLYLCSDHKGYYEHFGFKNIGKGYHPWGETSGIFECKINNKKQSLANNIKAIIDEKIPLYSNLANIAKILKDSFADTSWAGFYISNDKFDTLYLGPYQGNIACTTINYNKGVCGMAAKTLTSQLVGNVHKFKDHIACSSLTNSEIVVPIIKDNKCYGVIDLDSNLFDNFTEEDVKILEEVSTEIAKLF